MWENIYTMKRTVSSNEKERIIIVLWNVHTKKVVNQRRRRQQILRKRRRIYIKCKQKISAWHAKFIIEHKINNSPC